MTTAVCSICGEHSHMIRRGWCIKHYGRWVRHGDPQVDLAEQRFLAKVAAESADSCWVWIGANTGKGYGQFRDNGMIVAHRWSYERYVGPIPDGLELDHLCRNTSCVNPSHLEPVTPLENQRRRARDKAFCVHGHPYVDENLYYRPGTNIRACRTCRREQGIARRKASA